MNIGQQILFFISAIGAFNGVVLSLYIFLRRKGRSLTTVFLGIMLLAISIRVSSSIFQYFNLSQPKAYLQISLSACFLIGPAVYYFFRSALTNPVSSFSSWKPVWLILAGILVTSAFVIPYVTDPTACDIAVYVIYTQWAGFLIATGFLLRPVFRTLFHNAASLKITEKLWLLIFAGNCIILLVYVVSMMNLTIIKGMCVSGAVAFSLIMYLTVFFYLYGVKMENILQVQDPGQAIKPEKRRIAEADAQTWIRKLEKAIAEKELYKDPNLKLSDLAQKINISAHQLSQLLNDNLGKSFSTYINEYRINEACKLIIQDGRLSLEAIGYEVGYNSKSTFYSAFRKIKGTTPALFKETIEKAIVK
jgi:AraC-like DNA-binding protein